MHITNPAYRTSFNQALLRGLGAPVELFPHREDLRDIEVKVPAVSAKEALAGDWRKIGQDMQKVIDRYANS